MTYEQDPRENPDLLRKPAAVVIRGIRVRAVEPGRPTEARVEQAETHATDRRMVGRISAGGAVY